MKTKEEQVKKVEEVINVQKDMNDLTVDKIVETAPKPVEIEVQTKISMKELAKMEGILYIEPKKKLLPFGKLPDKLKAEHARDWEYVKGIYENIQSVGEAITFWYSKYPGDSDCMWEIPANVPVYVPRMIANLLESQQEYHTFEFISRSPDRQRKDGFEREFAPTNTFYRGKFRPIGAFV